MDAISYIINYSINNGSFFDAGTNYGDIIKIVLKPPK